MSLPGAAGAGGGFDAHALNINARTVAAAALVKGLVGLFFIALVSSVRQ
jgi:hypothetical protein